MSEYGFVNTISVDNQFMHNGNTSCPFISLNFLQHSYMLGYIYRYKKGSFRGYYENLMKESINIWKSCGSPDEQSMEESNLLRIQFPGIYRKHEVRIREFMKMDYEKTRRQMYGVLQAMMDVDLTSLVINRNHKFFVIIAMKHSDTNKKYLIIDSHTTVIGECSINNALNYITQNNTYYGGIELMAYEIDDVCEEFGISKDLLYEYIEENLQGYQALLRQSEQLQHTDQHYLPDGDLLYNLMNHCEPDGGFE